MNMYKTYFEGKTSLRKQFVLSHWSIYRYNMII